jgi:hypothetical protein
MGMNPMFVAAGWRGAIGQRDGGTRGETQEVVSTPCHEPGQDGGLHQREEQVRLVVFCSRLCIPTCIRYVHTLFPCCSYILSAASFYADSCVYFCAGDSTRRSVVRTTSTRWRSGKIWSVERRCRNSTPVSASRIHCAVLALQAHCARLLACNACTIYVHGTACTCVFACHNVSVFNLCEYDIVSSCDYCQCNIQ